MQDYIPFYGGKHPEMFKIERRCMDRSGVLATYLNERLPQSGMVLDIGAGNGFTALQLGNPGRLVVPLEPDPGMVDPGKNLPWVRGTAENIPFHSNTFDAAYATWAYFFTNPPHPSIEKGIAEALRILKPGGLLLIADNAGNDQFCSLFEHNIASDAGWWQARGFGCRVLPSAFVFGSPEEARKLLAFYGIPQHKIPLGTHIEFNIAVYGMRKK